MLVTCGSCKTKFQLDAARLKSRRSKVRCTRCGNVFTVDPSEEEVLIHVDLPDDEDVGHEDMAFPSLHEGPVLPSRAAGKRLLRRILIVVVALALLGASLSWIVGKMTSGPSDVGEKQSVSQTEMPVLTILENTQAYFLENPNAGGQIFVVEGEVSNESAKPASFILLEGKLYKTDNQVAQSQRCYAGNVMTRDELTKLSATDMQNRMMNREGQSLMNVRVPPSRRVPFMFVFHNLPEFGTLGDYSVEVISGKVE